MLFLLPLPLAETVTEVRRSIRRNPFYVFMRASAGNGGKKEEQEYVTIDLDYKFGVRCALCGVSVYVMS